MDDLDEIKAAKDKVAAAINANEGEVWPFNVWEAWQDLERSIQTAIDHKEDQALEAQNEYPQ